MRGENVRGEILQYDDQVGAGLISGDDGVRYPFTRGDLQRLVPIKPRDRVDFVGTEGRATEIFVVEQPAAQNASALSGIVDGPPQSSDEDLSLWGYFTKCMRLYVEGEGRARRKEYWGFVLFEVLILSGIALAGVAIDASLGNFGEYEPKPIVTALLLLISVLGFALPNICVTIRRFHDVGMSGWLYLLGIVPYVGGLFVFVVAVLPSQARVNKHGVYPKPWRG